MSKNALRLFEEEASRMMSKYAMKNDNYFNYWFGFRAGIDTVKGLLKSKQIELKDLLMEGVKDE